MRLLLLISLLFLLCAPTAHAQDTSDYHLRTPTAEEYLQVVPDVLAHWYEAVPDHYGKSSNEPIVSAILDELRWRFTDNFLFDMPFELLHDAYEALNSAANPLFGPPPDFIWVEAMLQSWLSDHAGEALDFEANPIPGISFYESTPVDFTGDGTDEILLSFEAYPYTGYIVLQQSQAGYHLMATPIVGESEIATPFPLVTVSFSLRDVTGDGAAEWFVASSIGGPGMWIHCGNLGVLTWRADGFTDILAGDSGWCEGAGGGYYPDSIDVEIVENDVDAPATIVIHEEIRNVWDCEAQNTRVFEWMDALFSLVNRYDSFAASPDCALYRAEMHMLEDDYASAIPYYEQALELMPDTLATDTELLRQLYAQARLAIAYALTDHIDAAETLLDAMSTQVALTTDSIITDMAEAMSDAPLTPMGLCMAAYNIWAEHERSTFSYNEERIGVILGRLEPFRGMMENRPPYPEDAGCNFPTLLDEQLLSTGFEVNRPVAEQLEALDIAVEATMRADLDGDSQDEWLVWPVALVEPILFVPSGETYTLSRPEVRRPGEYTQITTQPLPETNDFMVVDWAYLDFALLNIDLARYDVEGAYCGDDTPSRGDIRLWRLEAGELIDFLQAPLCEYRPVTDLFSEDGRALFAAAVVVSDTTYGNNRYAEATYQWNDQYQTYLIPGATPPPEPTPYVWSPLNSYSTEPGDAALFEIVSNARTLLLERDYLGALNLLDGALASHTPDVDAVIVDALHYWRALTLERMDRPDDALAEYLAIYQAAPDSAWGMLADLHLEPISLGD